MEACLQYLFSHFYSAASERLKFPERLGFLLKGMIISMCSLFSCCMLVQTLVGCGPQPAALW